MTMTPALQRAYQHQRAIGWHAQQALRNAKIIKRFLEFDGDVVNEFASNDSPDTYPGSDNPYTGPVRLKIIADEMPYDDSYLDTWDLSERALEHERQHLRDNIERNGVYGLTSEFWNGSEWIETYSCWGFIGEDWRNSGYDTDAMQAAIDGFEECLVEQARAIEASRPDMYLPA